MTEAELEEARALIAAASGGVERFDNKMIEDLHVAQAKTLLERMQGGKDAFGAEAGA